MTINYPKTTDVNQFTAVTIDLDSFTFPPLTVKRWRSLFGGDDGQVVASAPYEYTSGNGQRISTTLDVIRGTFEAGDNSDDLFRYVESMADDFNEDLRENWISLLRATAEKVRAYEVAAIEKVAAHRAKIALMDDRLKTIAALEPAADE